MEKNVERNRKIALTGGFSALVVVLGLPPMHLGMIPIGANASITIMHIPVILAVMFCGMYRNKNVKVDFSGLGSGITTGVVFGIFSLILASMSPTGPLDPLFVNPGVSVLPRMLFAVIVWVLWTGLLLIPHMPRPVAAAVSAFFGSVAHTMLVIGSLYVFAGGMMTRTMGGKGYFAVMLLLLPNAILESVAAAVICTIVVSSVTIIAGKKSKLSQESAGEK
jgi:uncharacterized membrane protein